MIYFFIGRPIAAVALAVSFAAQSIAVNESGTPVFETYEVEIEPKRLPSSKVDLSSHPRARMFRTRLRRGAEEGANFAGHYALVTWGCGTECQEALVVDLTNGKVLGVEGESEVLRTSRGLDFRPDSRLLMADPPCPEGAETCLSYGRSGRSVRYYLIEPGGLKFIGETPLQ